MDYLEEEIRTDTQAREHRALLEKYELAYEEVDYTVGLYDDKRLIACGSLSANCIKLLVVDSPYQSQGLMSVLVSHMLKKIYAGEKDNAFIFTKPEKEFEFTHLGFHPIVKTQDVLFLEKKRGGISSYVESLKGVKQGVKSEPRKIGSLVMNLNPLTLGHKSLIQRACGESDHVHLFVVKEDKSLFPYDVRMDLLRKGTREFENLTIHGGSEYIISSATFPTYFIKSDKRAEIPSIYAEVDAAVFGKYIAQGLGITTRYVGTEPLSRTTEMYNTVLKEVLKREGVEVIEVPRSEFNGKVISASYVRNYIREGEFERAFELLPPSTIDFFKSDSGREIIEKIERTSLNQRH